MRHFLDINHVSAHDLRAIIQQAKSIKAARPSTLKGVLDTEAVLSGCIVALIFEKPSTRTRTSFDVGVRQLGGQPLIFSTTEMHMGQSETIADTARVLSRYVDMIMIRTFGRDRLQELANYATVPVINGLTNYNHPCQIMADIMTFQQHRGSIKDKKVVYLGNSTNVCTSFIHGAGQFGYNMIFCGPKELQPETELIGSAIQSGVKVTIEYDAHKAVIGADLIVTDTWVSMHDDSAKRQQRAKILHPYQVNKALMDKAPASVLFMHCLPAHRGEEVTSEVMDSAQSVVFDEAENRLHVQKAIMRWCMGI